MWMRCSKVLRQARKKCLTRARGCCRCWMRGWASCQPRTTPKTRTMCCCPAHASSNLSLHLLRGQWHLVPDVKLLCPSRACPSSWQILLVFPSM